MDKEKEKPHAGLRSLDHYKSRLPRWRYVLRERLIPLMRWETPWLARFQEAVRTPSLDSYFAITANLGTHTFFMIFLPILFWCGHTAYGRGLVQILSSGVFFSGFVKDMLCLPRPLSPPLHRITMSGSAALEYGFPSTHSTNAVSVAVYVIACLELNSHAILPGFRIACEVLAYFYAASIVIGRIYCGMHGFSDIIIGSALGAGLSLIQSTYIDKFDSFIAEGGAQAVFIVILVILVLVRVHPEPADDCPCFDDSVAFAGVLCGVEAGSWHFSQTKLAWNSPVPGTIPFELEQLGWVKTVARIVLGIAAIFAWKELMKPALLKSLPPIFRVFENLGLSLPRKYFTRATEYDKVPQPLQTDNVMPTFSGIPRFISSISGPKRGRSVSIGPQSAADAYEALDLIRRRRRESFTEGRGGSARSAGGGGGGGATTATDQRIFEEVERTRREGEEEALRPSRDATPKPSTAAITPEAGVADADGFLSAGGAPNGARPGAGVRTESQDQRENEKDEREMFSRLEKPRVRYDVEVITKLIVYSGIAWIATEGGAILFHLFGLDPPYNR